VPPRRPAPAQAKPGGNAAASAACKNGGFVNYTDTSGNAFRNEGDCVSYAARGGILVPVAVTPFSVVYSSIGPGLFRASITGTGLEPNNAYELTFVWPDRGVIVQANTDASGGVTHVRDEQCLDNTGASLTSVSATGTPAGGVQTTYSLPLPDASICP
jgi:hypothetical protein